MKKLKKTLVVLTTMAILSSLGSMSVLAKETDMNELDESNLTNNINSSSVSSPANFGNLVSSPSYLSGASTYGANKPYSTDTYDLTTGLYNFKGSMWGCLEYNYSVYTNKVFVGKRSYHIKMYHINDSAADVTYEVINMSSNDEVKASGTIPLGKVVEIDVSGFSPTSKMYIKFTGASIQPRYLGQQFMEVAGYIC